ncbi:MAG: hypothetical protein ACR2PR_04905 [Pseudohongiellaceae bacterium]
MTEFINTLPPWIGWLLTSGVIAFALRGHFHFDLNQWLKDRREQKIERLRNMCPHVRPLIENGEPSLLPTFISPPGTQALICQECGVKTYDHERINQIVEYWAKNPSALGEQWKKMKKLEEKLGLR